MFVLSKIRPLLPLKDLDIFLMPLSDLKAYFYYTNARLNKDLRQSLINAKSANHS